MLVCLLLHFFVGIMPHINFFTAKTLTLTSYKLRYAHIVCASAAYATYKVKQSHTKSSNVIISLQKSISFFCCSLSGSSLMRAHYELCSTMRDAWALLLSLASDRRRVWNWCEQRIFFWKLHVCIYVCAHKPSSRTFSTRWWWQVDKGRPTQERDGVFLKLFLSLYPHDPDAAYNYFFNLLAALRAFSTWVGEY